MLGKIFFYVKVKKIVFKNFTLNLNTRFWNKRPDSNNLLSQKKKIKPE